MAILVIGAVAAGVMLNPALLSTSSASSSSSGASQSAGSGGADEFEITYNTLSIGYQSGLWSLGVQDVGGRQVEKIVVVLSTPTQTVMCTGINGGLQFANCIVGVDKSISAGPGGPYPVNATFSGYATGAGPGSAVVGVSYTVTISAVFADGTSANQTTSVRAVAAA